MKYLLAALLLAQDPIAQNPTAQEPTIRVNVNLVQIDVTVTDKQGKHVEGLTAEDFEVYQNGKRQPVLSVTWVGGKPPAKPKALEDAKTSLAPVVGPAKQLKREDVRRVVLIFVDDFSLSPPSMLYTREAIEKFVDRNLAEGDLVALFRASTGTVFTQQFTNDREQLRAAVRNLATRQRLSIDGMASIQNNPMEDDPDPTIADFARAQRLQEEIINRERQDQVTAGVMSSLRYLIQGLGEWPGRKSVMFFGESIQLADTAQAMFNPMMSGADRMRPGAMGGARRLTGAALRQLTETANQNGVVLYTIDPRGLQTLGLDASDQPSGNIRRLQGQINERAYLYNASQDGMQEMAEQTGGLFFKGTNDITGALARAVEDQEGYYLVAFQPDDETFEKSKNGAKYHRLNVKLKRGGLAARFRKGISGITDEERKQEALAPILAAMQSPFRSVEIPVRLTTLARGEAGKPGAVLRAGLHIAGETIQFSPLANKEGEAKYEAELESAIYLFDLEGKILAKSTKEHKMTVGEKAMGAIRRAGLVLQLEMPVEKAGSYQLRSAILDRRTQRAGSAVQFVEIADLEKKRLAVSELIVNGAQWQEGKSELGGPYVRRLALGETLHYLMLVYNAKTGPDGKPALEMQPALYKDGKRLFLGPVQKVNSGGAAKNGEEMSLASALNLGPKMPRGEYVLEVGVRDTLAPKKSQYAVRTMTFEIVDSSKP
ncbi:MAG: VWA domain-containing protein [Bryobacter sp.]|nr:VWA domain-containing protein [Bryobacter sp.]